MNAGKWTIGDVCWADLAKGAHPFVVLEAPEAGLRRVALLEADVPPAPGGCLLKPCDIAAEAGAFPPPGASWLLRPWETRLLPAGDLRPAAGPGTEVAPARLTSDALDRILRSLCRSVARAHQSGLRPPRPFVPEESPVPVSGRCWGPEEVEHLVDASLDFWLTMGRFNAAFEKRFAARLGRAFAMTTNSGSSANLLAVSALCSKLLGDRRLKPGDEVLTVAAAFPTTVAPLVQYGLVPVFVDAAPPTYNVLPEQLAAAVTERTRAVILAHTLGNPFDVAAVKALAEEHGLWLIEDACDALGSTYRLNGEVRPCGSFGHLSTFSFYPAHHITMGEGGAVTCDDPLLRKIVLSMRDWGRDCWCAPGADNTCKRRYSWKFPLLPEGYDHKYVYSHLGYNLKITDMQAAVGLAQLDRLDGFCAARRRNFALLRAALAPLDGAGLILPQATPGSDPAWFGFPLTLEEGYGRRDLLEYLNARHIGTRLIFAGNITRQPCFENVAHRCAFPLTGTDRIMRRSFWVGTYPGLSPAQVEFTARTIREWFRA